MRLSPEGRWIKGYSSDGPVAVYADKSIRVRAYQISRGEDFPGGAVAREASKELFEKGYLAMVLEVENLSEKRVTYKPSYTFLFDYGFYHNKPLDYTDLYEILDSGGESHSPGKASALKGAFFDLDEAIGPGTKSRKALVFKPLPGEARRVRLEIKEIYIGGEAVDVVFEFRTSVIAATRSDTQPIKPPLLPTSFPLPDAKYP